MTTGLISRGLSFHKRRVVPVQNRITRGGIAHRQDGIRCHARCFRRLRRSLAPRRITHRRYLRTGNLTGRRVVVTRQTPRPLPPHRPIRTHLTMLNPAARERRRVRRWTRTVSRTSGGVSHRVRRLIPLHTIHEHTRTVHIRQSDVIIASRRGEHRWRTLTNLSNRAFGRVRRRRSTVPDLLNVRCRRRILRRRCTRPCLFGIQRRRRIRGRRYTRPVITGQPPSIRADSNPGLRHGREALGCLNDPGVAIFRPADPTVRIPIGRDGPDPDRPVTNHGTRTNHTVGGSQAVTGRGRSPANVETPGRRVAIRWPDTRTRRPRKPGRGRDNPRGRDRVLTFSRRAFAHRHRILACGDSTLAASNPTLATQHPTLVARYSRHTNPNTADATTARNRARKGRKRNEGF